jgi:hypothetical protein
LNNLSNLGVRVRNEIRVALGLGKDPEGLALEARDKEQLAKDTEKARQTAITTAVQQGGMAGAGIAVGGAMTQEQRDAAAKAAAQGTPETWTSTLQDFGIPAAAIGAGLDYLFVDPFRELGKRQNAPPPATFGERWQGQQWQPDQQTHGSLAIGPVLASALKYLQTSIVGEAHGDELGAQTKAMSELTDQLKSLNNRLGAKTDGMAAALGYSDIGKRDGTAEAPDLGERTERIQKRLEWMFPHPTGGATFDERFGGGATFDERFGGGGPPAPKSYPQQSSWRDFTAPVPDEAIDRASLYSALRGEMTHKVEGTGTLTVDVNAPEGTQVDAEAGGIFAKLEINRQVQMERAASTAFKHRNLWE